MNPLLDMTNINDVWSTIMTAYLRKVHLADGVASKIAEQLYLDRSGGELSRLWGDDVFLEALEWQLRK